MKNINWDFKIKEEDYYKNNIKYGYNYEIDKYNNYIYDILNSLFDKLKNLDVNYFLIHRKEEVNKLKNMLLEFKKNNNYDLKKEKVTKILNIDINYKLDKLFEDSKIIYSNQKINSLIFIKQKKNNSELENYLKKNNKNNKISKIFYDFDIKNLFNFKNIRDYLKNNKNKYNLIQINILRYLKSTNLHNIYNKYSNYLLINLLYLILSVQQKNGELYLIVPPFSNNVQIQIIEILSNYFKNINIKSYFNYSNYYAFVIECKEFEGISTQELDNFYNNYNYFFEKNIESHIEKILSEKKIEGLYLYNIISNKIDSKLIKVITDFNKKYYKQFLENLKMKIDLYEFLNNKTTLNEQKDYIYDIIFKTQYKRFVEESRKLYGKNKKIKLIK